MLFDNLFLPSTSESSFLSGLLKLAISLSKDHLVSAFKLVLRGNIAYSTMKAVGIVMGHKPFHNPPGLLK